MSGLLHSQLAQQSFHLLVFMETFWEEYCSVQCWASGSQGPSCTHLCVYPLYSLEIQEQVRNYVDYTEIKMCFIPERELQKLDYMFSQLRILCVLKFLHIFHLSPRPNLNPSLRDIVRICTLAGGLWFHKTMKGLCLSMFIPSVTDVILIIYFFYLSLSAVIQCKLTEVRNNLYFSISEHLRKENTSEWLLLVEVLR